MIPVPQIPNKIYTIFVSPGSTKPSFAGLSINRITNKCLSLLPISTRDGVRRKRLEPLSSKVNFSG